MAKDKNGLSSLYFLSFFSKPSDYFLRKKNILKELKVINEELTAHRCQKTTV